MEYESDEDRTAALQAAADDLADRLSAMAEMLSSQRKPTRVAYGRGRIGNWFRRTSPEGFLVNPVSLQVLLPDGRLWSYTRSDASRFPTGRLYDARTDYGEFVGSRTFPAGREFIFLGAVVGRYSFGLAGSEVPHPTQSSGLCGIYGEGRSVSFVTADDAFAAIAASLPE